MHLRLLAALCLLILGCSPGLAAGLRPKIALVIGNSAYRQAPPLTNAPSDAHAVGKALQAVGFSVIESLELDHAGLYRAMRDFATRIAAAGPEVIAVVYYAGHGVQLGGDNYLVPVDAEVRGSSDVMLSSVSVDYLVSILDRTAARTRVVILDACRDNPFGQAPEMIAASLSRNESPQPVPENVSLPLGRGAGLALAPGLAGEKSPIGTLIAFATAPGAVALDGDGTNGPYAAAFVDLIDEPGQTLETLFRRIRLKVHAATAGRQTPWENSSLTEEIVLVPGADTTVERSADDRSGGADAAYEKAVLDGRPQQFRAFLAAYPRHAGVAGLQRLLRLDEEGQAWLSADAADTREGYAGFLDRFPKGTWSGEAAMRLAELEAGAQPSLELAALDVDSCVVPDGRSRPQLLPIKPDSRGPRRPPVEKRQKDKGAKLPVKESRRPPLVRTAVPDRPSGPSPFAGPATILLPVPTPAPARGLPGLRSNSGGEGRGAGGRGSGTGGSGESGGNGSGGNGTGGRGSGGL